MLKEEWTTRFKTQLRPWVNTANSENELEGYLDSIAEMVYDVVEGTPFETPSPEEAADNFAYTVRKLR